MHLHTFVLAALFCTLSACTDGGDPTNVDLDGDGIVADEDCDDDDAGIGAPTPAWTDADADSYGDPASPVETCTPGDGSATNDQDCDDTNTEVYPGALELCNGIDDNCDAAVDEGVTAVWYADADLDGYGDPKTGAPACEASAGSVVDGTDCDDASAAVNPGATEVCDVANVDEDCSGAADDADAGATEKIAYYVDADADGFGDEADAGTLYCDPALGRATDNTDCDDTRAAVNPDAAEEPYDGLDNDCDDATAEDDLDADGWLLADDCDDGDPSVSPDAVEECDDEIDNNCDGTVDEGCARFTFTDTVADDISSSALLDFFEPLSVESTDYISFSISGASSNDGQWCSERADWYVSNYVTYAPASSAVAMSEGWQKWHRAEGGEWSDAVTTGYANIYGASCDGNAYSWCSEWGLSSRYLLVAPANTVGSETFANGWSSGADWVFEIVVAPTRMEACGF